MKVFIICCMVAMVEPTICEAQDNYEVQEYASPTLGKDTTMVELHSNYSFIGNRATKTVVSTNHMARETIEITHGTDILKNLLAVKPLGYTFLTDSSSLLICFSVGQIEVRDNIYFDT
jgi:hypothetical protein